MERTCASGAVPDIRTHESNALKAEGLDRSARAGRAGKCSAQRVAAGFWGFGNSRFLEFGHNGLCSFGGVTSGGVPITAAKAASGKQPELSMLRLCLHIGDAADLDLI
jgi:hypothetical protein